MLLRILDEAVDLSRLEAGALALGQTQFALAEVIERVRAAILPLRLEVTIAETVPAPRRRRRTPGRARGGLVRSATKVRSATGYRLSIAAETPGQDYVVLHMALGDEERHFYATAVPAEGGRLLTVDDFFQRGFFGAGVGSPVSAGVANLMGADCGWPTTPLRRPCFTARLSST